MKDKERTAAEVTNMLVDWPLHKDKNPRVFVVGISLATVHLRRYLNGLGGEGKFT